MSQRATMLRSRQRRIDNSQPAVPPAPAFPWRMHRFNPSRTELAVQCRDCFGWVDDPRHS